MTLDAALNREDWAVDATLLVGSWTAPLSMGMAVLRAFVEFVAGLATLGAGEPYGVADPYAGGASSPWCLSTTSANSSKKRSDQLTAPLTLL